jgi:hypothetical protein
MIPYSCKRHCAWLLRWFWVHRQQPCAMQTWVHSPAFLRPHGQQVENGSVPAVILVCRNSTDTNYFQRLRSAPWLCPSVDTHTPRQWCLELLFWSFC